MSTRLAPPPLTTSNAEIPARDTLVYRRLPPASAMCLPEGYIQNDRGAELSRAGAGYWAPWRAEGNSRYQLHVYQWAARLGRELGLSTVLDVGCGAGIKLARILAPAFDRATGWDTADGLAHAWRNARDADANVELAEVDLEQAPTASDRTWDLVVCADVVEHLADPRHLLARLRQCAGRHGLILLSTPDRPRVRGRACNACTKPEHVREWSRDEFLAFVRQEGLQVVRSRLMPADETSPWAARAAERDYRRGRRDSSPMSCHAVLCRAAM